MTKRPLATDIVSDLLATWPAAARVLVRHHMHCVGCKIAPFESLKEACEAYGIDPEKLLQELKGILPGPIDADTASLSRSMVRP
jgi:hybrid cluster-associated redox disulfide protein